MASPPFAGAGVCAMCGNAPTAPRAAHPFLCASPYCAARHAALPTSHTCAVCRIPIPVERRAVGDCGRAACRDARLLARARDGMREQRAALFVAAAEGRDGLAAERGIPAAEAATYAVAVIPSNTDTPIPLPAARRDAFAANLRRSLQDAREQRARGATALPPTIRRPLENGRTDAETAAEVQLLNAACGVCRGNCCKSGGDHAYLRADAMLAYLEAYPTHDDEEIVARYLALLPAESLPLGCVFQHETGCTVPRELRSDVCNRFYCEYVGVLWNQFGPGDPVRAYVAHHESFRLYGGALLEIPVTTDATTNAEPKQPTVS